MPNITVSVADAQQTALAAEATAQSTASGSTVTAAQIATGVVQGTADRLRRDKLISWWKSKTLDQQQTIFDANQ
tara:strand:+ start:452 stop:673 length:222 start_codon:yes stop_codon:yes gene_type:complete